MKKYNVPVSRKYDFKPSNNQKFHENGSCSLFVPTCNWNLKEHLFETFEN